ncbi:MAG: (d)CMP kinase [Desulfobulbaceae bacterium]
MVERKDIVTIDGPSGAGKSTISKLLAAELHYTYLDTGAMYRVVGLQVERSGFDLEAENGREKLVQLLATLEMTMAPGEEGQETRVFLHGEDVSDAIRTPEMAMVASRVSAEPEVRKKLTEMQRAIGQNGAIVAQQLMEQGQRVEYGELLTQIQKRDRDDSSRALAPLKPAPDAVVIDSSEMSIDEVVSFMLKTVHEKKK